MSTRTGILEAITSKLDIILASSSPRRYEIVHDVMGIKDLTIMKPSFEENLDKSVYANDPIGYVCETSLYKAKGIVEDMRTMTEEQNLQQKDKLIICADTVVIDANNTIYEKPKTKEIQLKNLKKFCYSKPHSPLRVVTAVTMIRSTTGTGYEVRDTFYETTQIMCDDEIPLALLEEYVETGDGLNVAGGFKIQGMSGMIIRKIDGDYYNVVGLPLNRTFQAMYQESLI